MPVRLVIHIAVVLSLGLALAPIGANAQGLAMDPRGPRFITAGPKPGTVVDASRASVLRQRVALELRHVTLEEALRALTEQASLNILYTKRVVPVARRITLSARDITVAAALTEILLDAGVDVSVSQNGQLALVPRSSVLASTAVGTIIGRVTDAKTSNAIVSAEVWLEGTKHRTTTGENGFYKLPDVGVGNYTLSVRRVGYAKQSRSATVTSTQEITVDVALQPVVTQLDELVTTVTGEQRLRELGHVVGRINADSLVKEAPVSTITELLSARVPGLLVQQTQGSVGGEVKLQIRSPSSLYLSSEPIVIVDGIRYTSSSRGGAFDPTTSTGVGRFGVEPTSRLNDLNPHDIESIEVVKGPSAVTLYGTDAANGVIVITTKRGRAGPAQWGAYASSDVREIPRSAQQFPDVWWGWSDELGSVWPCALQYQAQGYCTQDSVTVLQNPLDNPAYSVYGGKPSWAYGASVAGGQPSLHYTVSVGLTDAAGPIQLPTAFVDSIKIARGVSELPPELLKPNTQTQISLRSAVSATLNPRAEVQVQATYNRAATRAASYNAAFAGPYLQSPANPNEGGAPFAAMFSAVSTEWTNRFTGSTGLTWRPSTWLQGSGTVGLDLANSRRYSLARAGETAGWGNPAGSVGEDRTQQIAASASLGLTATLRRGRLSSRTSVGAQYTRTVYDLLQSTGDGLPLQGGSSINESASRFVVQRYNEGAALGSYAEQVFGLNDRLFLTGAVRLDGATGFGRHYNVTAYPKLGLSWLASEEPWLPRLPGLEELRLRYAFGASGRQPVANWTHTGFSVRQDGTLVDGVVGFGREAVGFLGNPDLRPERVREHEFGLDAAAFQNRVHFDLTWNYRRTRDMIVNWRMPYSAGIDGGTYWNLGRVDGHGLEASVTVRALDTRLVSWDLRLQHSWQDNTVVERGRTPASSAVTFLEGYPLGAFVTRPLLGFADANGDGIIEPSEVQVGDTAVYMGRTNVPRTQTLSTTVGLFQQRVRLTALFDRQSGAVNTDDNWNIQCALGRCRAVMDPATPLAVQARAIATTLSHRPVSSTDFTALREVSAAFDVPARLRRVLGLQSASVSIAARNLALWTPFKGFDPEINTAGRIPLARAWAFRVNAGF